MRATASSTSPPAHQVRGVCDRHFAGEDDLVLLTIEADRLGPALKWETSHKGEAYPHLYGPLPLALVRPSPTFAAGGTAV